MGIIEQIKNQITNLEKELNVLMLIHDKNKIKKLDEIEIRGASLSLLSLYNGIERIIADLLKNKNINVKDKESWHTLILDEALKNQIVSLDIFKELKAFLAFRHFIRHTYSFEINPDTIRIIIDKAPGIIEQFIDEIIKYLTGVQNNHSDPTTCLNP